MICITGAIVLVEVAIISCRDTVAVSGSGVCVEEREHTINTHSSDGLSAQRYVMTVRMGREQDGMTRSDKYTGHTRQAVGQPTTVCGHAARDWGVGTLVDPCLPQLKTVHVKKTCRIIP